MVLGVELVARQHPYEELPFIGGLELEAVVAIVVPRPSRGLRSRRRRLRDIELGRVHARSGSKGGGRALGVESSAHQHSHQQSPLVCLLLAEAVVASLKIGLAPLARKGPLVQDVDGDG